MKFLLLKVKAGYGLGQFGELYELLLLDLLDRKAFKAKQDQQVRLVALAHKVLKAQLVQYLMSLVLRDQRVLRVHKVMLESKV